MQTKTRFYYGRDGKGKLVRDKLPEVIEAEGHLAKHRKIKKEELAGEIVKKFAEELEELAVALRDGDREEKRELADLWTLLESYRIVRGFSKDELEAEVVRKKTEKGAFDTGVVIEYVDLDSGGGDYEIWLNHFRKNSDRYLEEK